MSINSKNCQTIRLILSNFIHLEAPLEVSWDPLVSLGPPVENHWITACIKNVVVIYSPSFYLKSV